MFTPCISPQNRKSCECQRCWMLYTLYSLIKYSEIVFTVIYIAEMILKWIGWGFWGKYEQKAVVQDKDDVFKGMVNITFRGGDNTGPRKDEYVGYFMDGWNWLDFIVVILGSILPLAAGNSVASVSSIRALRILRALRAIPRVPSYVIVSFCHPMS